MIKCKWYKHFALFFNKGRGCDLNKKAKPNNMLLTNVHFNEKNID